MKRILSFVLCASFILAASASLLAEEVESADSEGWISLFDGQSLGGWKKVDEAGGGDISVKNGAITLGMGAMATGICHESAPDGPFPTTGYEIEYTAMRAMGNDFFAALTFPVGESFCTFINGGWGGTLIGLSSLDGFDASENNTSGFFNFKNKIWYRFCIRVTERMIRVGIDDEEVAKVFLDGHKVGTRIEMSRFQPLGFATWVCEGHVKEIRYRLLTPEELAEIAHDADRAAGTKRKFPVSP